MSDEMLQEAEDIVQEREKLHELAELLGSLANTVSTLSLTAVEFLRNQDHKTKTLAFGLLVSYVFHNVFDDSTDEDYAQVVDCAMVVRKLAEEHQVHWQSLVVAASQSALEVNLSELGKRALVLMFRKGSVDTAT